MDARCRRMRSDRRAVGVDECFGMLGCLLESVDGWMSGTLGELMGGWITR